MWIQTQLKNVIINTDNVSRIFIDRQKGFIKVKYLDEATECLGSYNEDKIDKVFNDIIETLINTDWNFYKMPLGGEV